MKAKGLIRVAAALAAAIASIGVHAQAYAVGANGNVKQEQTAPVIAPENQASSEQLAKLFEVMRIQDQMKSMRQIVPSMVQQQIHAAMKQTEAGLPAGTKLTPEQREGMEKVMNKYVQKAMDLYPADEMLTDMTTIYQRHLSKDDVDGLIAFYGSPAGQHLLDAQPMIAQEFMPIVMGKVSERSQAMTKEMMKEMSAFTPSASAKPAPKPGTTNGAPK